MDQLINTLPDTPNSSTALVVFSGGQDSTTCLGWARKCFRRVYAIGFDYGQKHSIELTQAKLIADIMGVPFEIVKISALSQFNDSALIGEGDVNVPHHRNPDLPASFVPNRNALFLTLAHAYAQKIGASHVVTGVCQTDFSGYPDCREGFIQGLEKTLNEGYLTNIRFETPIMHINKAQTFALADACGVLGLVLAESHTCYYGERTPHPWGHGCGVCPACVLRAQGYEQYLANYGHS